MSVKVPNGALVHISSGLAAAVTITAISNAATAVCTATNTYSANDIVVVNSGWSNLDNRVASVVSPSGTAFNLSGFDTTSTIKYPTGGGAGTAQKVTGWTQLSQILDSSTSGGDQQFVQYQFLEDSLQKQIPTVKSAQSIKFSVADDPTQAGYVLALAADDDRVPRVVRLTLPNGSYIYYYAYVTLQRTPSLDINAVMKSEITLSMLSIPTRY